MTGKRKRYGAEFKARVALEALRGELTAAQLATKHGIHHTMVGTYAGLQACHGKVQRAGQVIHVIADRPEDLSGLPHSVGDRETA